MEKTVVKRDGAHEPFDEHKIARVVRAAGLDQEKAEQLAATVKQWFSKQPGESVTSLAIRDTVFGELEKMNKYAAGLFQWYQKSKD